MKESKQRIEQPEETPVLPPEEPVAYPPTGVSPHRPPMAPVPQSSRRYQQPRRSVPCPCPCPVAVPSPEAWALDDTDAVGMSPPHNIARGGGAAELRSDLVALVAGYGPIQLSFVGAFLLGPRSGMSPPHTPRVPPAHGYLTPTASEEALHVAAVVEDTVTAAVRRRLHRLQETARLSARYHTRMREGPRPPRVGVFPMLVKSQERPLWNQSTPRVVSIGTARHTTAK